MLPLNIVKLTEGRHVLGKESNGKLWYFYEYLYEFFCLFPKLV
jgi:hypothetical protein